LFVFLDTIKLKTAIKSQTDFQPKLMGDVASARTDDMFTNLTVYYDRNPLKIDLSGKEQFQEYNKRSGTSVKKCKDIFIDTQSNPTSILVTGKPGIGKTLFCQKLIRDWAFDRLFEQEENNKVIPDIQFAYLLTFRQLSLLGEKELNLREVLNCLTLLDEHSKIDDSLFEYLIANPSKVLIILDGYDEYSEQHRKEIADDSEQEYPNDPREKMPIPALCSKLIKGKILRGSVVLVSSRPDEAGAIGKINFDRYVEVTGFSSQQVTEFVEKYFSKTEKEETKNTVLEHIVFVIFRYCVSCCVGAWNGALLIRETHKIYPSL
jgi:predicted NACHT family NTPase